MAKGGKKKQELANMNLSCAHGPAQVPHTFFLLLLHQIKATTADPSSTEHQQTTWRSSKAGQSPSLPCPDTTEWCISTNYSLNYRQQLSILHILGGLRGTSPCRRSLQGLEPVGLHARLLLLSELNLRRLGAIAGCSVLWFLHHRVNFFWSRRLWNLFIGSLTSRDPGFLLYINSSSQVQASPSALYSSLWLVKDEIIRVEGIHLHQLLFHRFH